MWMGLRGNGDLVASHTVTIEVLIEFTKLFDMVLEAISTNGPEFGRSVDGSSVSLVMLH